MDIAISESTSTIKNDASVIKCIRVLLTGNKYERQEVYTESFEGMDIDSQAIKVRRIMEDFEYVESLLLKKLLPLFEYITA